MTMTDYEPGILTAEQRAKERECSKLTTELERYDTIIGHYNANPIRIYLNIKHLREIGDALLNLTLDSLQLKVGKEWGKILSERVGRMTDNLSRLLYGARQETQ